MKFNVKVGYSRSDKSWNTCLTVSEKNCNKL